MSNSAKNRYDQHKSLGLCVVSGCNEKSVQDKVRCQKHLEEKSLKRKIKRQNHTAEKVFINRPPDSIKDITGQTINNYFIVGLEYYVKRSDGNTYHWKCKCINCGKEGIKTSGHIKRNIICRNCSMFLQGESGCRKLMSNYKSNCKKINRDFSLTYDDFRHLTSSSCYYCNLPPRQKISGSNEWCDYYYNGIDRKDNKIGYTKENCVSCCGICNKGKSKKSYEEFKKYIENILIKKLYKFICDECNSNNIILNKYLQCKDCGSTKIKKG